MEEKEYFIQILKRATKDQKEESIDCVYCFAETRDEEESSFAGAKFAATKYPRAKVGLCDLEKEPYAGFRDWKKKLEEHGIEKERIIGITEALDLYPSCTSAEAWGLVRRAKKERWQGVCVVAPPFHILRAYLSTISAAIKEYPKLKICVEEGAPEPWHEVGLHTQSTPRQSRKEEFASELEKIERYIKQGDILPPEDIWKFLTQNDK